MVWDALVDHQAVRVRNNMKQRYIGSQLRNKNICFQFQKNSIEQTLAASTSFAALHPHIFSRYKYYRFPCCLLAKALNAACVFHISSPRILAASNDHITSQCINWTVKISTKEKIIPRWLASRTPSTKPILWTLNNCSILLSSVLKAWNYRLVIDHSL